MTDTTSAASARSTGAPAAAAAISNHLDTRTATTEVAHALAESLRGAKPDLLAVFASFHHASALASAAESLRASLAPGTFMATTAESVLGGDVELEGRAGLSAIALHLPGARLSPFRMLPGDKIKANDKSDMRARIGAADDTRAVFVLADPFSTPIAQLLGPIGSCLEGRSIPVFGGLASGASQPGHNVLILDDFRTPVGLVGVTISGAIDVDILVSQGCRPIGQPLVVTKSKGNVIEELGGKPAMQAVQNLAQTLPDEQKAMLNKGVLMGVVINEYKERFGRGDFLVRNVMGVDQKTGSIAVAEPVGVGKTVQLHARDAATAVEDLQLLLDAQELDAAPFGAILFNCNGRGTRLFEKPDTDVSIIRKRWKDVPLAGFFAGGEIGPIGDRSFVHGHTACVAMFRRGE